jgi:tetratricopeptide (TPR) repeat protein
MKSQSYANKAIEIDPNNYFAYLQLANIYYYAPAIAGGSKVKAMDYYLKALNIIERNPEMLKNNWNYLNLLVTIINCYIDNKQYDKALQYAKKVLKIEPNFLWVKNQIYPELIKKTI